MKGLDYTEDGAGQPQEMLLDHLLYVAHRTPLASFTDENRSFSADLHSQKNTSINWMITTRPHGYRTLLLLSLVLQLLSLSRHLSMLSRLVSRTGISRTQRVGLRL
jgi:hypothetical protein